MNAKTNGAGLPNVIYLQDVLDDWLGEGRARVILPITDPYVVHHRALGSFATVYLPEEADAAGVAARLGTLPGVELVLGRSAGCRRFELPADRIGDLMVLAERHWVLGTSEARHDLSEQRVPFILSRPTPALPTDARLRNFDIFDAALNEAT